VSAATTTRERVEAALAGLALRALSPRDGTACFELASAGSLHEACLRLRDRAGFETNTFVTAIDRFPEEPRFELHHQFLSLAHRDRVRLVSRVPSNAAEVPTIADLYPGAAYSERECFDMFGIRFAGHVGLKRLLMPEDYDHFPLRKDFPHQGIEPDRLYREWEERRHRRAGEHGLPRHPEDLVRVPPHERLPHS
jgi:NADH-quinone oxidoreductase subunit C